MSVVSRIPVIVDSSKAKTYCCVKVSKCFPPSAGNPLQQQWLNLKTTQTQICYNYHFNFGPKQKNRDLFKDKHVKLLNGTKCDKKAIETEFLFDNVTFRKIKFRR